MAHQSESPDSHNHAPKAHSALIQDDSPFTSGLRVPPGRSILDELLHFQETARTLYSPQQGQELRSLALAGVVQAVREDPELRKAIFDDRRWEATRIADLFEEVRRDAGSLSLTTASKIAESAAALGFRDERLFQALGQEAHARRKSLTGAQISRFVWALTQLDIEDSPFVAVLVKAARSIDRTDTLLVSQRARIAWGLCHLKPLEVRAVLTPGFLTWEDSSINSLNLMYQALLVSGAIGRHDDFPRRKELQLLAHHEPTNNLEKGVETHLRRYLLERRIDFELHPQQNVGGVFVDLVLYLADRTVAIECDGYQFHFSWGPDGRKRLGRDHIQDRVLEAHGMEVAHIVSTDWNQRPAHQIFAEVLAVKDKSA